MPFQTRLDGRSENNNQLAVVETRTGNIVALIEIEGQKKIDLRVSTVPTLHLEKPNGFTSKKEGTSND